MHRQIFVASALLFAMPAFAQATNNVGNAAVKNSTPRHTTSASRGHNSFTMGQAKKRLAKSGYAVTMLTKNADGLWTAPATRGGKQVTVTLDFKGNITEQ